MASRFGDACEVKGAGSLLAAKLDDDIYQIIFTKALAVHLEENPEFSREMLGLMGGARTRSRDYHRERRLIGSANHQASDNSVVKGGAQNQKGGEANGNCPNNRVWLCKPSRWPSRSAITVDTGTISPVWSKRKISLAKEELRLSGKTRHP
jgi:hypothetical protein